MTHKKQGTSAVFVTLTHWRTQERGMEGKASNAISIFVLGIITVHKNNLFTGQQPRKDTMKRTLTFHARVGISPFFNEDGSPRRTTAEP